MSVFGNVSAFVKFVMKRVDNHIRMRKISQLIEDISRFFPKLLKYLNSTVKWEILISFVSPSAGILKVVINLDLLDALLPGKPSILLLLSRAG